MSYAQLKPAAYEGRTVQERLAYLERKVAACKVCPHLAAKRENTVFGEGCLDAGGIFILGEAPGVDEDTYGRPFVGRSGQLLDRALRAVGLERSDVYIANSLKCRPDPLPGQGNRAPSSMEIMDCAPFVRAQLEILEPAVIVALGNTALEALGLDERITKVRGKVLRVDQQRCPVVPTWHPAYVLRDRGEAYEQFIADLELACEVVRA
jgi:DNA polymerase